MVGTGWLPRMPTSNLIGALGVAGLLLDEGAVSQLLQCLLDLGPGVHDERAPARDGLAERPRRGEEKATAIRPRGGLDHVAVLEDHQGGRVHRLPTAEAY